MSLLTYEQQLELVSKKLAVVSRNEELGLDTFKYHRRVMYDYLWKEHPEMMECRGHTYDIHTGELVIAAPRKSFNYLEDGWWKDVPLDTQVTAYKKYNGFMACMTAYNGQAIVSTTGSTKSDYVKWAREMLHEVYDLEIVGKNWQSGTWLFEIIHPDDPHIVSEDVGVKYLGYRVKSGAYYPIANEGVPLVRTLGQMLKVVEGVKHEGFMLYDKQGNVCKLKSPYYVGKKKLMRQNKNSVDQMYLRPKGYEQTLPLSAKCPSANKNPNQ